MVELRCIKCGKFVQDNEPCNCGKCWIYTGVVFVIIQIIAFCSSFTTSNGTFEASTLSGLIFWSCALCFCCYCCRGQPSDRILVADSTPLIIQKEKIIIKEAAPASQNQQVIIQQAPAQTQPMIIQQPQPIIIQQPPSQQIQQWPPQYIQQPPYQQPYQQQIPYQQPYQQQPPNQYGFPQQANYQQQYQPQQQLPAPVLAQQQFQYPSEPPVLQNWNIQSQSEQSNEFLDNYAKPQQQKKNK